MKFFLKQNWPIILSTFVLILIGSGKAEYFVSQFGFNVLSLLFPFVAYFLLVASIVGLIAQSLTWIKNKKIFSNFCFLAAAVVENIFLLSLPFFPSSDFKEIGYSVFLLCSIFVVFLLLLQLLIWFILGIKKLLTPSVER